MPISLARYVYDDGLDRPELIHVSSERELATVLELQSEISELNGFGLIPLTPLWVNDVGYLFYFNVSDEYTFYENLERILDDVAENFRLPPNLLTPDKNYTISVTP